MRVSAFLARFRRCTLCGDIIDTTQDGYEQDGKKFKHLPESTDCNRAQIEKSIEREATNYARGKIGMP